MFSSSCPNPKSKNPIPIQNVTRRKTPFPKSSINLSCLRAVFTNFANLNSSVQISMCQPMVEGTGAKISFCRFQFWRYLFYDKPGAIYAAIHSGFLMVPRPFAPARAMRSPSRVDVIQPFFFVQTERGYLNLSFWGYLYKASCRLLTFASCPRDQSASCSILTSSSSSVFFLKKCLIWEHII